MQQTNHSEETTVTHSYLRYVSDVREALQAIEQVEVSRSGITTLLGKIVLQPILYKDNTNFNEF